MSVAISSHSGVEVGAGAGWKRKGPCGSGSSLIVVGARRVTNCTVDPDLVDTETVETLDIEASFVSLVDDDKLLLDGWSSSGSCLESAATYFR